MPNPIFPSATSDEPKVDATPTQPVEANDGGEASENTSERVYKNTEVEQIVKDRLLREQKKHAKEMADRDAKLAEFQKSTETQKPSPNVENDFRAKQAVWEQEKASLTSKLDKYRRDSLRGAVERKLVERDCLDPEVAFLDLTSKGIVKLSDDGEIEVENVNNSLDDAVASYLTTKPHLVRSKATGGVGSKQPGNVAPATDAEQLMAQMKNARPQGRQIFGARPR